jgi:GTPase SAR1 family protein
VLGYSGVGVTTLVQKLSNNGNQGHSPALSRGDEVSSKFKVNGSEFIIHAPMGSQAYAIITGEKALGVKFDGVVFVYDILDPDSLEELPSLLVTTHQWKTLPMLFLGNRLDLASRRQVSVEKVKSLIGGASVVVAEVSAKKNLNVQESFEPFARKVVETTRLRKSQ